ncbi:MAG: T9SS type A sorting domain-containing protein [Ignavibacteriae bacterium]|nr:T9SS type A sorting domain-containing protein [Ignavibacteriota bacterium]
MKNILSFILLFLSITVTLFGQSGWEWQNPLPQGNSLYDCFIRNQNEVIVVGSSGTIMKSTDGGSSWDIKHTIFNRDSDLRDLQFLSGDKGLAVGEQGTILLTTNFGETWTLQESHTTKTINSVSFYDSNVVIAVGYDGVVLHSDNGGLTWNPVSNSISSDLWGVVFLNRDNIIAIGDSANSNGQRIWKSTDGGLNWNIQFTSQRCSLKTIFFVDSLVGWVASCDSIYKTTDGGDTWITQHGMNIRKLHFTDTNNGFGVGSYCVNGICLAGGMIYKTTDGGSNWTSQIIQVSGLSSVHFTALNNGFAVGSNGALLRTTNSGVTWEILSDDIVLTGGISRVSFIDKSEGIAIGNLGDNTGNFILTTSDGGTNWNKTPISGTGFLNDVVLIEHLTGIIITDNSILRTINGGNSWIKDSMYFGRSIRCIDANTCFVMGNHRDSTSFGGFTILKTTNGGETWNRIVSNDYVNTNNDFFFTNMNHGIVVGNNGKIFYTANGGSSWTEKISNTTTTLRSVFFVNSDIGFAVGGGTSGVIQRTTDGGNSWLSVVSDTIGWLTKVAFGSSNTGFAVGYLGSILKTTNSGLTWIKQEAGVNNTFYGLSVVDDNFVTIVGGHGILHTSNGGVNAIGQDDNYSMAQDFSLEQNYPNPFNPITVINYSIPQKSFVSLKIYDVVGREIAVLVNEEKMQGNYSINWNATNLTSGVYFYRLHAGSVTLTEKLVLVK